MKAKVINRVDSDPAFIKFAGWNCDVFAEAMSWGMPDVGQRYAIYAFPVSCAGTMVGDPDADECPCSRWQDDDWMWHTCEPAADGITAAELRAKVEEERARVTS